MTTQPIAGPKGGIFGLKNAFEFQKDSLGFLTRLAHDYPDIIHFQFGPVQVYLVTHPDYIHEALVKQSGKLTKWTGYQPVAKKIGNQALVYYEGEEWKRDRRFIAPAFHTQRIKAYHDLMVNHTQAMFQRWNNGGDYEVTHEMKTLTMGVIGEVLFDIQDIERDAELTEALRVVMDMFMIEATSLFPVPDWVPIPRHFKEQHALKVIEDYLNGIITQRRKTGEDRGDVLSALLLAMDTETGGACLDDQQIHDELLSLFVAGHETTAITLTWALYLLAKHPDIQDKLYQHVTTALPNDVLSLDDLEKLTYVDQILNETLRLYPPAWAMFVRDVNDDLTLGDHIVPKGSVMFISPWVMHHDPRYWDEPQRFDPERFTGNYKERIPQFAYLPFGGGPRVCVGNHMAMMEAKIMLAMMVKNYRFEPTPGREIVEPQPLFTVHPKNGLLLKVTKRA